jgi:hypothetical protein
MTGCLQNIIDLVNGTLMMGRVIHRTNDQSRRKDLKSQRYLLHLLCAFWLVNDSDRLVPRRFVVDSITVLVLTVEKINDKVERERWHGGLLPTPTMM